MGMFTQNLWVFEYLIFNFLKNGNVQKTTFFLKQFHSRYNSSQIFHKPNVDKYYINLISIPNIIL